MKKILFILLLILPFFGFGQGWEKNYGGTGVDEGNSVQQTTDGGYIVCGHTNSFGQTPGDIYIIKTNSQGDTLWTKTFRFGFGYTLGNSIQQTIDGGYIICGSMDNNNLFTEGLLLKIDGGGNEQWWKNINYISIGMSVKQTFDGGYVVTGFGGKLIKSDSQGDTVWTKTLSTNVTFTGYSVQQTIDSGYVICGGTYDDGWTNEDNILLIKTNSQGDIIWSKIFGDTTDYKLGYSVKQTNDSGYIICGGTNDDLFLLKTDSQGDSLWIRTFGGVNKDIGYSVQQTNDGGYIITGVKNWLVNSVGDSSKVWLIKTDGFGNYQWDKTFGGLYTNIGKSVQQTSDGGYIVCGTFMKGGSGNGIWDVYLIKTDGNGNITSTFNIPTPSSNRNLEKIVDILGRETKPQTNTPFIEIYDDGTVEKKIVVE